MFSMCWKYLYFNMLIVNLSEAFAFCTVHRLVTACTIFVYVIVWLAVVFGINNASNAG